MANYSIEIERNNVTLAQFLRYVRQQCEKKGIYMEIDRGEFEKPSRPESYSYTVINGEKKCHSASYRTATKLRRKLASYQTAKGYTRFYYTDEFEEYEETKLCRYDWAEKGTDALSSLKSANHLHMTRRSSSLIGTAPCITRYANLPLTTGESVTAITIKPTGTQQNKEKAPAAKLQRLALKCSIYFLTDNS